MPSSFAFAAACLFLLLSTSSSASTCSSIMMFTHKTSYFAWKLVHGGSEDRRTAQSSSTSVVIREELFSLTYQTPLIVSPCNVRPGVCAMPGVGDAEVIDSRLRRRTQRAP